MFGKRIDHRLSAERRRVTRQTASVEAAIVTPQGSHPVTILNVSNRGAMLLGTALPGSGGNVWIRIGTIDILATVSWGRDGYCGVTFDGLLNDKQVDMLRRACSPATT